MATSNFAAGMRRGAQMALDPQRAIKSERRKIETRSANTVEQAWSSTGKHLRTAMNDEARRQKR